MAMIIRPHIMTKLILKVVLLSSGNRLIFLSRLVITIAGTVIGINISVTRYLKIRATLPANIMLTPF